MPERLKGTIKWFNPTKGYGFIEPQSGGKDVFVHITEANKAGFDELKEGDRLEFEVKEDRGRAAAVNLKAA